MSIDAQILKALRSASQSPVSGAELSEHLGVTRAAVWGRIEELRALGYEIEATPHSGYRLLSCPDVLHPDDLAERLGGTRTIGRDIRVFNETTSTNDIVEKLARDGVKEGVVVFAESQTQGRGRLGRKWISPAGKGLWFSVLLRPGLHPLQATQVTLAAAASLRRAIHSFTGLEAKIKWPNDILISGRKIAGILTEMSAELDSLNYVILGIGIDVNLNRSDFPNDMKTGATSIRSELGHAIRRADLAVAILHELDADYAKVIGGSFASIATEWERYCDTIGQRISVHVGQRSIRGRAESVGDDGELLLRTDHGHLERIFGGDLVLEK